MWIRCFHYPCVLALIHEALAPSTWVLSELLFLGLCICYGGTEDSVLNFSTGNKEEILEEEARESILCMALINRRAHCLIRN